MNRLLADVRIALRHLRRNRGFSAMAILTLALGIGATTTVFSVVYAVLWRPLPFPNAGRLVQIVQVLPPRPGAVEAEALRGGLTTDQVRALADHSRTLQDIGRYSSTTATLSGIATPARLTGARVAHALFAGLGVRPVVGRLFVESDEASGAEPVIVLSDSAWRQYFGGDPAAVGRLAMFDGRATRVVGIMPQGFGFPSLAAATMSRNSSGVISDAPEFWRPFPLPTVPIPNGGGFSLGPALALLRSGVTVEQAVAEVRAMLPPLPRGDRPEVQVVSAGAEIGRGIMPALILFAGGVALVLLIACANVVNLLLSGAVYKRTETGIRRALGASSGALVRSALVEGLLLSLLGGMGGAWVAFLLAAAIRTLPPHVMPRLSDIHTDAPVLAFAVAVSLVVGIAIGAVSALRDAWSAHRLDLLKGAGGTKAAIGLGPSGSLVVGEITLVMMLLAGSGLLINSFVHLASLERGVDTRGVLSFHVTLPADRYADSKAQERFYARFADTLRRLPEVGLVTAANYDLQQMPLVFGELSIDGRRIGDRDSEVTFRRVMVDYFATLRIPLLAGRAFTAADRVADSKTVVVNEAFARKFLAADAVGHVVAFSRWPQLQIIGVVGDVRETLSDPPRPTLFLPPGDTGDAFRNMSFFVRTASNPAALLPAVRAAAVAVEPQLALYNAYPLEEMYSMSTASPRFYGGVALACAVVAVGLGAGALYGILSYFVGVRTWEIGIRMALGADRRRVLVAVVRRGLLLTLGGVGLGLAGALFTGAYLRALLFDITPNDPSTLGVAAVVFLLIAAVASYVPARRATLIDPAHALKSE